MLLGGDVVHRMWEGAGPALAGFERNLGAMGVIVRVRRRVARCITPHVARLRSCLHMLASVALIVSVAACKSTRRDEDLPSGPDAPTMHLHVSILGGSTLALERVVDAPDAGVEARSTEPASERGGSRALRLLDLPVHATREAPWPEARSAPPMARARGAPDSSR
jgi:hypothetical protein